MILGDVARSMTNSEKFSQVICYLAYYYLGRFALSAHHSCLFFNLTTMLYSYLLIRESTSDLTHTLVFLRPQRFSSSWT